MQLFGGSGDSSKRQCRQTLLVTRHCPMEMRSRTSWSIDQFAVAKKLGGGYASTVHLAVDKATGIQVAVKVYHRVKLSQLNQYQVKREIRIHSCLDHPNVLRLYAAFEDEAGVYLITEYASRGDVFGELDRRGGTMTEGDAVRQVLAPFMSALRYLHALNIIHRDIKPENLLMTSAGELKVADFGLSIDITQERPVTRVGTLDYMAPEVVICPDKCLPSDNKEKVHLHYTHLVDAWAVGVLAYELTVGRAPFDAGNKRATIEQILHGQPSFPSWLSEQARHFIAWSLTKDVKGRPDVHQLMYHPWITGHAPSRPRSRATPGRAASIPEMHLMPAAAPASDNHAHMEARHKALVAGHVGGPAVLGGVVTASDAAAQVPAAGAEVEEEEEACSEWDAANAPAGRVGSAVVAPAATAAAAPAPAAVPVVSPFALASAAAAVKVPGTAQPAAAAAPLQPPASTRGVLESAAENLRAYVSRCQSANNIDSLRAAVLAAAPEPSNACFEPGGRFYNPKASLLQQAAARAGTAPELPRVAPHDSVSSVACAGSPKPGAAGAPAPGAAQLPPATPSAPRPPALQLVRLPAHGLAAAPPKAPVSPARSGSPMPITPEGAAGARAALFGPGGKGGLAPCAASPTSAVSSGTMRCGGTPCSRSSGVSMLDCMQVDVASAAGSGSDGCGSDGSSCGSATEQFVSCSGRAAAADRGAPRAAAAMVPPEPVSPPKHAQLSAAKAVAAAMLPKALRGGEGAAWFGLQCVNFLKPSKS